MRVFKGFDELKAAVGQELGVSDWMEMTQDRINTFAEATGDHQWIHVDVERCKRDMPDGKPIAHGYLTLSLVSRFVAQVRTIEGTRRMSPDPETNARSFTMFAPRVSRSKTFNASRTCWDSNPLFESGET